MYTNQTDGQDRSVCRLNYGLSVCCPVVMAVLLVWSNAYANTDEFVRQHLGEAANANVHADSQPFVVQNIDDSEVVEANDKESKPVDIDTDLLNVVQLDAGQAGQNSRLDLADSMQSLDIVDSGSSVKLPHAVDDVDAGIDNQKANVELSDRSLAGSSDMIDQGNLPEAVSVEVIEQNVQPLVEGTSVNLPVTNAAADARSQVNDAGNQLRDVSGDIVSEENTGLPHAVVLALLALICLVPVARRSDHHHV